MFDPLHSPYPRDLVGYGRNAPHAAWPNGARIAVQFVINYEEAGRTASCMVMRRPKASCPKSSARSPGPASGI